MTTQTHNNIGYYKVLKDHYTETRYIDAVWDITLKRMRDIYPQKSVKEILAFLDSESGTQLATNLLDGPGCLTYAVVMIRIALLTKQSLADLWANYQSKEEQK